jgi:hypothetical protein
LTKLASQAAIAVRNAHLFEDTQRRLGETAALLKIAEILNPQLDLDPVLKEIARRTAQVLSFERCSVFLWKDGRALPLMSQFADGRAAPELWAAFQSIAQCRIEEIPALTEAIRSGAPLVVPDARVSPLVPAWWVETFDLQERSGRPAHPSGHGHQGPTPATEPIPRRSGSNGSPWPGRSRHRWPWRWRRCDTTQTSGHGRQGWPRSYVKDNGIGIDPTYHERIFEVFERLKEVKVEGTGVGLAIVKKIVQASGGKISVESAKRQGATFRFTWPKGPASKPHGARGVAGGTLSE